MSIDLDHIENVYLIGIGGIGMSALARYFNAAGYEVGGYDGTATPLTRALEGEGVWVHYTDGLGEVPRHFHEEKEKVLVVYTPAVPSHHSELCYFQEQGFAVKKRAAVLGLLTKAHYTVAVAGTHGKTTTSTMVAHLLHAAGRNCTAFLGGIAANFRSNLLLGDPTKKQIMVVEADEYDRSFLHLRPDLAVVTTIDADHLDIYGDAGQMEEAFGEFAGKVDAEGQVFWNESVDLMRMSNTTEQQAKSMTYGIAEANYKAKDIEIGEGGYRFSVETPSGESIEDLLLPMPGKHNVMNATAAVAVATQLGISAQKIREGLTSFKGIQRRFEWVVRKDGQVFIDDYAHHPTELRALLGTVKEMYPKKEVTVVFQPHLFSRTQDFADGFGEALSIADRVVLLDIYPARELPIAGVDSEMLLGKIGHQNKILVSKSGLLDELRKDLPEVLVTAGAGDISELVPEIEKLFSPIMKEG